MFPNLNLLGTLLLCSLYSLLHCAVSDNQTNITRNFDENVAFTAPSGNVVARWVPVSPGGNFVLNRPDPAGLEESNPLYLCRGKANNSRNKPGKLIIQHGTYSCSIPEYGELKRQDFDLLETPKGATSWVPKTDRVPPNAIKAGNHPYGSTAYVCRATNAGALIPGALEPDNNSCFVTRAANEHVVWDTFEILVVNAYGLSL